MPIGPSRGGKFAESSLARTTCRDLSELAYQLITLEKRVIPRRGEMIDMKKVIPLAILALILIPAYVVAAKSDSSSIPKPSIVLVHGAWADGSSWSRVIALLQDKGYTVYAPA